METKRLVLAIVLSCALFFGWNVLSHKMGWIAPQPTATNSSQQEATAQQDPTSLHPAERAVQDTSVAPQAAPVQKKALYTPTSTDFITIETPLYKAVFSRDGAVLQEFLLFNYKVNLSSDSPYVNLITPEAAAVAPLALYVNGHPSWKTTDWNIEGQSAKLGKDGTATLIFVGTIDGIQVERHLSFAGDSYVVNEKTSFVSPERKKLQASYTLATSSITLEQSPSIVARLKYFVFGGVKPQPEESQYNHTRVAWLEGSKFAESSDLADLKAGIDVAPPLSWMGIMNNYFIGAVILTEAEGKGVAAMFDSEYVATVYKDQQTVGPEQPVSLTVSYFIGPKSADALAKAPGDLSRAIDYGWFSIISKPLVLLLDFFYGYVGNYGVAIILMTILIKAVFWPLSNKSYKSMSGMKKLQPLMVEIREKYKDDKEGMNRELMALYKRYKVTPVGGCLPILVQLPVFFGLYRALMYATELRHAPFISYLPFTDIAWIQDLAAPDPYCIIPILTGISAFIQQRLTPAPGDPTQAKIMMFMPLFLMVISLGFPSGLVIYWFTNNLISIGQQWWQLRGSSDNA